MKKRNILLITLTVLGLTFTGCQSQASKEPVQQETINDATQAADNNTMEADAPKSADEVTESSEATTAASTKATDITESATEAPKSTTASTSNTITEDKAKQIALKDANVNEKDITGIRIKTDTDDGRTVYEVEFYVQAEEYDYEIDVNTGKIINKDYEIDNDFSNNQSASSTTSGISKEDAIDIVLKKVPGATKQQVRIKLDKDDGHDVYEGEIFYNNTEYEFELSAEDGRILEWSEDNN